MAVISPREGLALEPLRRGRGLLLASCAFLVIGGAMTFALVWMNASRDYSTIWAWILIIIVGAVALTPIVRQLNRGKFDPFHPMVFASLLAVIPMVVVKGSWVLVGGEWSLGLAKTPNPARYLTLALLYSLIGYGVLMLAFYSKFGKSFGARLPELRAFNSSHSAVGVGVTLFMIGFALSVWLAVLGASIYVGYAGDITYLNFLTQFALLRKFGLFLLVFHLVRRGKGRRGALVWIVPVALSAELVLALASGYRSQMMWSILLVLAAYRYGKGKLVRTRNMAFGLALTFVALVLGFVLITVFRQQVSESSPGEAITLAQVPSLLGRSLTTVTEVGAAGSAQVAEGALFERFEHVDDLALVLAYSADLESAERAVGLHHNLASQLVAPFVPRAIWASKPVPLDWALDFNRLYWGAPSGSLTQKAPTLIGDLYRNHGLPAVLIGMAFLGLALRVIHTWLIRGDPPGATGSLLFILLITGLDYGNFFGNPFSEAVYVLVVFGVTAFVVRLFTGAGGSRREHHVFVRPVRATISGA